MPHTINLMVADDDHLIQELLVDAAKESQLPFRISATDNGRDCLTLLNGGNIDLAFIDIHMPELSGMEAIWVARRQGNSTFVTLMSGAISPEAYKVAQKLRAYEFLAKPFNIDDVMAIMRTYVRVSEPMRILIVDDSSTVRGVVQKVIQQSIFKCAIAEAANGATAIRLIQKQPFDTVLLDCNMPALDGLTTLQRLRALQPSIKVVMISAERDARKEQLAREAGAHGFLYKPFYADNIDRMLHAVHRLRLPTLHMNAGEGAAGAASMAELFGRPRVADSFSRVA